MFTGSMRMAIAGVCGAALLVLAGPAAAESITREGFAFPDQGDLKIVVFRPDVHVGSRRVGGIDEPNAEWTETARHNIQTAMESAAEARSAGMVFLDDMEGENAALLNDYRGLFEAVAGSMFQHATMYDRLPTKTVERVNDKGRKQKVVNLDWTLGEGAAQLKDVTGADYAMFVFTHDSYGDAGTKVAQVLMAGLFGSYVPSGVHVGYAGMVDLNNGDIVWFNTDLQMGGDPREADGAEKRVGQLLRGLPVRDLAATSAVPEWMTSENDSVAEGTAEVVDAAAAAEAAPEETVPAESEMSGMEVGDPDADGAAVKEE